MYVLTIPAIFALEITSVCNNHCPGCSNIYARNRQETSLLSAQDWRDVLKPFISEAVQIRLTGGEPTLHPDFFEVFDYVRSHKARVTIFTNGRWVDPKTLVEYIKGKNNFSGLLVSLHGAKAETHEAFSGIPGSFNETLSNIRLAIANGIRVGLSTIITRHSYNEVDEIFVLGQELGVSHIAFNRYIGIPLPEIEPTLEQSRIAIQRINTLAQNGAHVKFGIGIPQCFVDNISDGCLAGVAYASIDPWGNLRPCAHSPKIIGSLRERSLEELWHSQSMQEWRALMPSACVQCAAYSVCHGGCRAVQELHPSKRDPLRQAPLKTFERPVEVRELPSQGRPIARVRIRDESFGYAVLGRNRVLPVLKEALPVIEACTGELTFSQLASEYGEEGLNLLGELWVEGMLEII